MFSYKVQKILCAGPTRDQKAVYEAAGKTFLLPPWDAVQEALVRANNNPLNDWLRRLREDREGSPFGGPDVFVSLGVYPSVLIYTEGGRSIHFSGLAGQPTLEIDFRSDHF